MRLLVSFWCSGALAEFLPTLPRRRPSASESWLGTLYKSPPLTTNATCGNETALLATGDTSLTETMSLLSTWGLGVGPINGSNLCAAEN